MGKHQTEPVSGSRATRFQGKLLISRGIGCLPPMPSALRGLFSRGAGVSRPLRGSGSLSHSLPLCRPLEQTQQLHRAASPRSTALTRALSERKCEGASTGLEPSPSALQLQLASCSSSSLDIAPATLAATLVVATAALLALPEPAAALSLDQVLGSVEEAVAGAGALGPVIFIAAYVLATVLLVPASVLTLAAGALFGPILGTAIVSVASTLGASAAFLVGRYLARPAVERRIASNRKFAAVDSAIKKEGPRIVLLLRLSPLFPFGLLNYSLSLTSVEFLPYVLSSWIGMLPGTIAYVALGGAGRAAAESAAGTGLDPLRLGLYIVGAVATLWATKIISQTATKALEEASGEAATGGSEDSGTPLNR